MRDALERALGNSGVATAALKLFAGRPDRLVVLAYHRILDIPDEDRFMQDPELVSASVADFERQMRYVQCHCTPLKMADVVRHLNSGQPLPRRSVVVTFDDGHVDNYTHAFPVLRKLGMSACIFLSTDYLDTDRMFWFDRAVLLLRSAPNGEWMVGSTPLRLDATVASRRAAALQLLRALKRIPNGDRLQQLQVLEELFGAHVKPEDVPDRSALTWSQVTEMAAAGIEFGSHTCSHPILAQLDDDSLQRELVESRELISRHLAAPVDIVAYPIGKFGAFNNRVISASRAAGYQLGLTYESGINHLTELTDPASRFELRRLAVERYTGFPQFKAQLAFPAILS